jgi:hypothetical protein
VSRAAEAPLLNGPVEHGKAGYGAAKRVGDVAAIGVLGEVAAGSGLACGQHGGVVGVGGEDDDGDSGVLLGQQAGRLGAVEDRHVQVQEDGIGVVFAGEVEGFSAVGCSGDDLDVVEQAEHQHQAFADAGLVVGHDDAERPGALCVRVAHWGTCAASRVARVTVVGRPAPGQRAAVLSDSMSRWRVIGPVMAVSFGVSRVRRAPAPGPGRSGSRAGSAGRLAGWRRSGRQVAAPVSRILAGMATAGVRPRSQPRAGAPSASARLPHPGDH